jgi:hypothetical protein
MKKISFLITSSFLFSMLIFSVEAQPNIDLLSQTSEINDLMVQFREDEGSLVRFYVIPNSPERRGRLSSLYQEYLSRLDEVPFDKISYNGKVDFILFKRDINYKLSKLKIEDSECAQIEHLVNYGEPIYQLEKKRRRGNHLVASEVADQINEINKKIEKIIQNSDQIKRMNRALIARAETTIQGHQIALQSIFEFYNGYDPEFTWWVLKPFEKLDSTLSKYITVLSTKIDTETVPKDDGSGIIGFPVGRDELVRQLQYEMIPYSPEELIEIAKKEVEWCTREYLKASRAMGYGDNWKDALEKIKQSYVPPGEQPQAMMKIYDESMDFIKSRNLISIPPVAEETWRMKMMTPERQLVNPFFTGGETFSISYPTLDMSHEDKLMSMRGNTPLFSRGTVQHELIPGHHMQGFMNKRFKSYRNFRTPFWTEGWAQYFEFVLWDLNFPSTSEQKIGMLFWRMHRSARIIFSLNYHLGKWTPQQCIDFIVNQAGFERANAEGEVRRSFTTHYPPLYQAAYMLGALQFYALKKELVDTEKMTILEFHDQIMKQNNMPVEMVRAILTSQPLGKDFKSLWKFYN